MHAFNNEIGAEILKSVRAPEFLFPTLLMPTGFYALFAVILNPGGNNALYLLATYGVFAVMGPAIFGFGVGVANERDRGWLQLKRVVPAPPYYYVGAKLVMTLIFAIFALLPIYLIAGLVGEVALSQGTWFALFGLHLFSAIPFVFIGLTLGFQFNSGGAIAFSNIVYLGLSILGGLWVPVLAFPEWMKTLALFTPSYHLAELALSLTQAPGNHQPVVNAISLTIMTLILAVLATLSWSKIAK